MKFAMYGSGAAGSVFASYLRKGGALCRVYDAIPGCMAAVCSLAERPPERLQFVPPREICT